MNTMNRKSVLTLSMLLLTAAMLLSVPAFADSINIALANPVQNATVPSTVSFTATVTAPSTNTATIYLNGDSFNVDVPLSVDDSGFFFGFPLSMNPGDTFTGLLFTVDVPVATAYGPYYGYFQILGGSDGSALNPISNVATFQVNVIPTPVPEPGSMMLLGTGALAVFGTLRRKLRS
jgi:PEP-CTERM motif